MRFSPIAVGLAALALSFAVSPALAFPPPPPPPPTVESSHVPKMDLGIDIRQAGSTSASVKAFVDKLAPDTQAGVRGGCRTVMKYPAGNQPDTVSFCAALSQ